MKTPAEQVDELKYWLATAPVNWEPDQNIRRYLLPTGEYISCVLWNSLYHITGTDIVRSLVFRFQAFGRPVKNIKKFEEGVFSDLRNLKPGMDASLEEPKSEFLEMLYKNNCIRTQKKQKGISPNSSASSSPQLRSLMYDAVPPIEPAIIKTDDPSGIQQCDQALVKSQMYPSPDLSYCSMDELSKGSFEASSPQEYFVSDSPWSTSTLEDQYVDSRHSSPDGFSQAIVPSSNAYNLIPAMYVERGSLDLTI
ncbi:245_t:CDS:2 [Acaulospora morrowiae]|uniref:245_t:CDS:1 n=1 Tax=Acaulospora morrowiae TaxID=94023 RepID=A0A9N9DEM2_9GLOM|nr:245_t:CDS:2 [Acaulospora morrowiae]